jgi:hypothetical protein
MKTKSLLFTLATVGMLLTTSCSNDEAHVLFDNEAQVTFSLGLENVMNTRAISDGKGANKLIYAIFDSEGNRIAASDAAAEFPFEKTLSLIKGEEYTAVFWAQNKDCDAYSISEDYKTITVNYDNALNNDESRDAFFRTETFTVTNGTTINVVLKRPFAQLNLGITEEEWQNAKNVGLEVASSSVEIKQAATTFNLIDGTVGNAKDITFTSNAIPTTDEILKVDINSDGIAENYKYISMCYFLANDATDGASQTTLDGLKFTLTSADGSKTIELQDGLANAPVQRNYRTNIVSVGNLLTNNIDVNILIDPIYDGEHTLSNENIWEKHAGIYTEEALAGKTIEIPEGWYIRNGYIVEPMPENWTADSSPLYTKPYTIDGKGNTVTFEPYNYKFKVKNSFAAADSQPVNVMNITFAGEHSGIFGGTYGGVAGRRDYNTIFTNVQIVNNGIYAYNENGNIPMSAFSMQGTATLNNCTIKGTYWVGPEKDIDNENNHATNAFNNYGVFDIFVPNKPSRAIINDSEIGSIRLWNQAQLILSGTTTVDKILAKGFTTIGYLTIEGQAKVKALDIDFYSGHASKLNIKQGTTIDTLQLNSISKDKMSNIKIEEGANIALIIYKGVEYTSIEDFKAAL